MVTMFNTYNILAYTDEGKEDSMIVVSDCYILSMTHNENHVMLIDNVIPLWICNSRLDLIWILYLLDLA